MDKQPLFWAANLKLLRTRKKLSQQHLSDLLGLNRNKITAQESGKTRNPRMEDLVLIAGFFQVDMDLLIKTDLSLLPEAQLEELEAGKKIDLTGRHIRILPITVDEHNEENMEYVPVKARAGYRSGFSDPAFIAALPKFTLPELPRGKTIRMFPITGDSMEPIPHGSHIIAQYLEDWSHLKNNTACVLILKGGEEEMVFKIVGNHIKQNRTLSLHSLNSAYDTTTVHIDDVLEIWTFIGYISKQLPEAKVV
ncbi:helix-turn-helix domain-containing protein [Chitinophaga polysaccharea]|uniref:XRE family transcriptional regulator n=1 Tax=Chitinophaga TaxID=79328 RepID=UPI001455D6D9|nr:MULTISPECIES: helix-turn-helix domain-containing protein [Chitinophaga]NLR60500.1 helix-turn-helix domain-containing protein [Chitinophaga polysaccharea]NLU90416.1 helix-turn-helix domain-containing protein [Chitinophaga sp. Ak27]